MTVKVTFKIGHVGDTFVDKFDMLLSEFIYKAPDMNIDFNKIVKIEVE
jgi:hypothetical protein